MSKKKSNNKKNPENPEDTQNTQDIDTDVVVDNIETGGNDGDINQNEISGKAESADPVGSVGSAETVETVETIETAEFAESFDNINNIEDIDDNNENIPGLLKIQPPQLSPKKKSRGAFQESIFGITAILMIICVVTVFIVSVIHSLTAPAIEKRLAAEKREAVAGLFGENAAAEILTGFEGIYSGFAAPVTEVSIVKDKSSQKFTGYCVTVTPQGFSDQIIILVAVNPDISVKGTKILSMNETSGIGTKIGNEDWFGEQFKNKKQNIEYSKTEVEPEENAIKIIAGATKSSKAFLNGVNAALDVADEIRRQMAGAAQPTEERTEEIDEIDGIEDSTGNETNEMDGEVNPDE